MLESPAAPARRVGAFGYLRARPWPVLVTLVVVATGMAYCLAWGTVVRHVHGWVYSGDIWGAYRSAHYIAWGDFGSVYAAGTGIVTFPGILLLFAPVAALTGHLGMTEAFPFYIPHPTAWLVLGPYEMLLGCIALFAANDLAERLGVSPRRRAIMCVAQGVVLWPVIVFWGHPEDPLAVALALYALVFGLDRRWTGAGWLFGAAVVTQPLVLLALPVFVACAGAARLRGLIVRSLLPGALLIATPLAAEFRTTWHALVDQPNYPRINHATPWTFLAPHLGGTGVNLAVAGGPGRIVAVAGACVVGVWARRHRHEPVMLVWAVALALALRCFTESVMDAYYVWPALALALVVSARRTNRLFAVTTASAVWATVCGDTRLGEWPWWVLVTGGIALALVASAPHKGRSRRDAEVPIPLSTAGTDAADARIRSLVLSTR
jgi:hypothetical protein